MGLSLFGGMILVASQALSEPEAINLALARPMATLQIVAGLLLLATLLLVPVRRLLARVGRTGLIEIDDRMRARPRERVAGRALVHRASCRLRGCRTSHPHHDLRRPARGDPRPSRRPPRCRHRARCRPAEHDAGCDDGATRPTRDRRSPISRAPAASNARTPRAWISSHPACGPDGCTAPVCRAHPEQGVSARRVTVRSRAWQSNWSGFPAFI